MKQYKIKWNNIEIIFSQVFMKSFKYRSFENQSVVSTFLQINSDFLIIFFLEDIFSFLIFLTDRKIISDVFFEFSKSF